MGLTAQYFGVLQREADPPALPRPLSETWEATTAYGRWHVGMADEIGLLSLDAALSWFDETKRRAADHPIFTALVEDSDWCLLSVAGRGSRHIVIKPEAAEDYQWGQAALGLRRETSERWDLVDWLAEIGVAAAAQGTLAQRLATENFVFAEGALFDVLDVLGISPEPPQAPSPFLEATWLDEEGTISLGGREVKLTEARYVFGRGESFYGIWDREAPGPPITRFADDDPEAWNQAQGTMYDLNLEWARAELGRRPEA